MKAEQMFEELGYECKHIKQCIYYTKIDYSFMRIISQITFNLKKRSYYCDCGMAIRITNKKEKEAINQQCKELGWV